MRKFSKTAFGLYQAGLVFCGMVLGTIAQTIISDMNGMAFIDTFTVLWTVITMILTILLVVLFSNVLD